MMAVGGASLPADSLAQASANQSPVRRPVAPGSVTGHVMLSDTGGPARFAAVTLQPVVSAPAPEGAPKRKVGEAPPATSSRVVHTMLDGSFVVPGVAPGNYYVLADAPGYLSAVGVLTREQLDHPTKEVAERIQQLLVPVAVVSGKVSTAEVRLHRGASLSGTVRFDDGTPYENAAVSLWKSNDRGEWKAITSHLLGGGGTADDLGHFRFAGLPAGFYRVSVGLETSDVIMNGTFNQTEGWYMHSIYTLAVYSPAAVRAKDARTIELKDGQDESGVQIEVPLSKLHAVSGALVEKGAGRSINAGHVALVWADDGSELASTDVSGEDAAFHMPFVPEGSYTLKVTKAEDLERTEVPNPPGMIPPTETKTKVLQSFGPATQPLVVTSDVQGVLVAVPPASQTSGEAPTGETGAVTGP